VKRALVALLMCLVMAPAAANAQLIPFWVGAKATNFGTPLRHIVIIDQENRTVDNLFNGFPGANTVTSGTNSLGSTVNLVSTSIATTWDPDHHHVSYAQACNTSFVYLQGAPKTGDIWTVTINGHPVSTTAQSSPSRSGLVASMFTAIINDATDSAIIKASAAASPVAPEPGQATLYVATLVAANTYSLSSSVVQQPGSALTSVGPAVIGGPCANTGFDYTQMASCSGSCPAAGTVSFYYVNSSYTTPLWAFIQNNGTLSDHNFQPIQGPSSPAHAHLFASTTRDGPSSPSQLSENPAAGNAGCEWSGQASENGAPLFGPSGNVVGLLSPICLGTIGSPVPTITDKLDAANISWKYYEPTLNPTNQYSLWDACAHFAQCCGPVVSNTCTGSDYNNVIAPETTLCGTFVGDHCTTGDIAANNLAQVTWVIPSQANSDHPKIAGNGGPNWVARIMNTIGESPYWSTTAVCVTWDDWGGWYDHLAPPQTLNNSNNTPPWVPGSGPGLSVYEYGFRVPLMCASPYSLKNTVDSTVRDSSSINHFIETVFGLGQISTISVERAHDDLAPMFNFNQAPLTYTPITLNSGL
jgi:phospholipase C